jgi:hypothetical protein
MIPQDKLEHLKMVERWERLTQNRYIFVFTVKEFFWFYLTIDFASRIEVSRKQVWLNVSRDSLTAKANS